MMPVRFPIVRLAAVLQVFTAWGATVMAGQTDVFDSGPLNLAIPDASAGGVSHSIEVIPTEPVAVADIDIALTVDHTWVGDLCVTVEHLGVTATLMRRVGAGTGECHAEGPYGCDANNLDIVFSDEGTAGNIDSVCQDNLLSPPDYVPQVGAMSLFDGLPLAGNWTITVSDNAGGDTGQLVGWSVIHDCAGSCQPPSELRVDWYSVDAGGGTSAGLDLQLTGTIAQNDAGNMFGGELILSGGFWNFSTTADCLTIDTDGDGSNACEDCNDDNDQEFPGNSELLCDGLDNDCDPLTDDNPGDACSVQSVALGAEGPRYLEVTPAAGSVSVALLVTSEDAPCLSRYVDLDPNPVLAGEGVALLVDAPVYRLPADWGTLHLRSEDVVPGFSYSVQPEVEDVGAVAEAVSSTTHIHGDVDENGSANFADILGIVQGFQGTFDGPRGAVDLLPCLPNAVVNFEDILTAVQAFQGQPYNANCPLPCGG